MERDFSEATQIFLKQFLEILEDFKKETRFQIFLLNKEGELINKLEGVQPACKFILATPIGRTRCKDCFKIGFLITKTQRNSLFLECYANFAICWLPIIRNDSFVGAIIMCGKRFEREEGKGKMMEKFNNLVEELEIFEKKEFFQRLDQTEIITEEEFKNYVERLKKLMEILTEIAQTPIKEIFG